MLPYTFKVTQRFAQFLLAIVLVLGQWHGVTQWKTASGEFCRACSELEHEASGDSVHGDCHDCCLKSGSCDERHHSDLALSDTPSALLGQAVEAPSAQRNPDYQQNITGDQALCQLLSADSAMPRAPPCLV